MLAYFLTNLGSISPTKFPNISFEITSCPSLWIPAPYPIADKSIGSINANDINRHIGNLIKPNGDKYSRSSLVKALEVIRVLLDTAYEMDLIKKNPAKTKLAHKSLPKQEKTKHIYLTEFQVSAISNEVAKGEFPEYARSLNKDEPHIRNAINKGYYCPCNNPIYYSQCSEEKLEEIKQRLGPSFPIETV
jgi:hypothetical protein